MLIFKLTSTGPSIWLRNTVRDIKDKLRPSFFSLRERGGGDHLLTQNVLLHCHQMLRLLRPGMFAK